MTSRNGRLRPKSGRGFFTVDRRIWDEVCNLGMNEAVAYLVLAQGTGRDNRSTKWSSTALHKYAGVSFERGIAAIERIIRAGYLRYGDNHTNAKPRYELATWAEFTQRDLATKKSHLSTSEKAYFESLPNNGGFGEPGRGRNVERFETLLRAGLIWATSQEHFYTRDSSEPDPIWLPNTIITGTAKGEEPPVKRVRKSGDIAALRLFVDLYHSQNLRADGGISPWLLRTDYERRRIGQQGIFTIWAFNPYGQDRLWWQGPFKHYERNHEKGTDHPVWRSIRLLEQLGLLQYAPTFVGK